MVKKGFSLIELLLAIVLLGILTLTISTLFTAGLKAWSIGYIRHNSRTDLSQAMQRMVRDIRQARSATVISTQIDFTAELDSTLAGTETYRYRLFNNELRWIRTSPEPTTETILGQNMVIGGAASNFSSIGNLITIQLQNSLDQIITTLRNNVRPRNL